MDLKKFDSVTNADKGVDLILEASSDKNEGAAITLYGFDSARCKEKERDIQRRNSERRGALSPKEVEDQMYERIVNATKGWRGIMQDGKVLEFSDKNAESVYRQYPEIKERVTAFIYSRANFFTTASGN